ncbi:hypothetical protein [Deinococcus peraridilitoris]|uniref:DUF4232 domain-containing protein n=1 Tax=Deinococcus peraridilitoris (strain DSM 19664 / LMG 22246 / CIP 109416 / KR-200) TaxID=937777 RepID=L0A1P2_DEIPD|nr:hypothetical protein [Deinococcus peraridilitoris]AFZ67818.1 hypothetical protein Deipe_2340 [Deinococcus peraridilitoris DSM 19664]
MTPGRRKGNLLLSSVLVLTLSGCGAPAAPPDEVCPAVFVVPTLSVSPTEAKSGERVTIEVTTPLAGERCTGYPVEGVDYFVGGTLLEAQRVSNLRDIRFQTTWQPQPGVHGVPARGSQDIEVTAKVHVSGWPEPLDAMSTDPRAGTTVTVRVTVP